jgi:hypothetical protein
MSRRVVIGGVLVALLLALLILHVYRAGPRRAPAPPGDAAKTYAQLAAASYRTLTASQSVRLLRFATVFQSCMKDRGIELAPPIPKPTKIVLHVETSPIPSGIRAAIIASGDTLGGPPSGSSL